MYVLPPPPPAFFSALLSSPIITGVSSIKKLSPSPLPSFSSSSPSFFPSSLLLPCSSEGVNIDESSSEEEEGEEEEEEEGTTGGKGERATDVRMFTGAAEVRREEAEGVVNEGVEEEEELSAGGILFWVCSCGYKFI
jgi:hypothetical protein